MLNIEIPFRILYELYTMPTMTTMRLSSEDFPQEMEYTNTAVMTYKTAGRNDRRESTTGSRPSIWSLWIPKFRFHPLHRV
jgi:hypothetical protein